MSDNVHTNAHAHIVQEQFAKGVNDSGQFAGYFTAC